jgi:hypothetical protein
MVQNVAQRYCTLLPRSAFRRLSMKPDPEEGAAVRATNMDDDGATIETNPGAFQLLERGVDGGGI